MKKSGLIGFILCVVAVASFAFYARSEGAGNKPAQDGAHAFVLVVPEGDEPPISHKPLERWRAWHMVTIERGDSTIERCMNCHEYEKFCYRCHTYVGVPEIEYEKKETNEKK